MPTTTLTPAERATDTPLHEMLRAHARTQPDKAAYVWYGRVITYRQLDALSDACAALLASHGVGTGDRVALFMGNCPQYVIAHFGIQKLGAIVGPCSPLFKAVELQYQLDDLGAQVVIAARSLVPLLEQVRAQTQVRLIMATGYGDLLPDHPSIDVPAELLADPSLEPVEGGIAAPAGPLDFLAELVHAAPLAPELRAARVNLEACALMTYTSGTTGLPKGAMLSYRNATFKTVRTARGHGVERDDVLLAIAPVYHIAGMLMGIDVPIYRGATCVLLHRFEATATLQAIERQQVSWWYAMAPMLVACMQAGAGRSIDLSSLRLTPTTSFGITLTEALAGQWHDFCAGAQAYELAYGLSETHTCDTYMPRTAVRWGTHGRPADGVEIRIVDPDDGSERPLGEPGEITLRSGGNFLGYWNKPQATLQTLRNGWVHTGDMGRVDAEGYLTFMGRFKEMIKVSGYSVFPEEVETLLIRHPAIAQAAVIGVPDPTKGEVVKAVIVLKPDHRDSVTADQLIAWSREAMSAYKVPRFIEFRTELPATGAGKLLRRLLKSEA